MGADSERRGKPRALFWPWAATSTNVICVTFGLYATGLDWIQATLAMAVGAILSFGLVGLVSVAGQQGGAPAMVTGRTAFGFSGNKFPTLIGYIAHVGWEAINAVLATLAAETVTRRVAPDAPTTPVMIITFTAVILLSTVAGIYGCHLILRIQKWLTLTFVGLTAAYVALTVDQISFVTTDHGGWGVFCGGIVLGATTTGLGWAYCSGDYTRYLPLDVRKRSIVSWTTLGGAAPAIVLITFGTLLAAGDPDLAAAAAVNPLGALSAHLPTWFLVPFLALAVLGFVSASAMDLYSSGLSLLALGVRLPRQITVLIDAALVAVVGGYIVFATPGFFAPFQAFLIITGVPMAAWTGVVVIDIWQRRAIGFDRADLYAATGAHRRVNPAGVGWLAIGTVVGLGLVTSPDPHIGPLLGYLLTPAARAGSLGSSNVGIFAALVVAAVGYAAVHRPTRRAAAEPTRPAPISAAAELSP